MADAAPILIWETDATGVTFVNQHYLDFFGVSFDEIKEMGWSAFLHPDDLGGYVAAYVDAFSSRQPYAYECRFRRADGLYRWLRNTGAPVGADRLAGGSVDITDLIELQSALKESEEQLRMVKETGRHLAILTTDTAGSITSWSLGAQTTFGWSANEVIGRSFAMLFTPEDQADGVPGQELEQAAREGRASDERWHLKRDNGHAFLNGSVRPLLPDAEGRKRGFMKVALDDTRRRELADERDRAAQEREQETARQRALIDITDRLRDENDVGAVSRIAGEIVGKVLGADLVGYGIIDPITETITVAADWTSPEGVSVEGVVRFRDYGAYIEDLKAGRTVVVTDAYTDSRTREFATALGARSAVAFVNTPIQERGSFIALLYVTQASPRDWNEGELGFIREVVERVRSVTERVRSDRALRVLANSLEEQVRERTCDRNRLWTLSADIMLIAAFDGVIQAVNPAWQRMLGWTEAELVGSTLFALIHPDDLTHTIEGASAIGDGRSYARFENRYRHKDGSYRHIVWNAGPGDGVIIAVGRDATIEKEQAQALAEAEEALRQSQKMEAVGQLTGGLAHDFNNLLTGVTGSLELMQTRIAQGRIKDLDRYINAAQGAAKRAAALTHRLLAFSRRQTLDPKPTNVNRLVHGMEELIRRTVGPSIEVEPMVGTVDLWSTLVDPGQLENALLNLSINARDAMPDGGKLTIETANRWLDQRGAHDRDLLPGQYVSLCVSDTGTGMTPEVIAKAFDPFFTTKPIGMGTGLGLSMIYGFAKQSNGQVRIYSEVGQGTTVCIYLPRHLGEAEVAELAPELVDAPRAEDGQTVLVVDDEPTVRMLVTEVLEDLGYRAIEAADGAAGLQVLRSDVRIDLLVTDVGLPGGMNGRQVADAARVARPELKVLFITGYAENAVLSHGHLDPGMHVLTKPFAMEALASRIKDLIDSAKG